MVFSILFAVFFEIVFWVIFIGIFIRAGKMAKARRRNVNKDSKPFYNTIANANVEHNSDNTNEHTYCDYCGAEIKKNANRCPSCKAKLNK